MKSKKITSIILIISIILLVVSVGLKITFAQKITIKEAEGAALLTLSECRSEFTETSNKLKEIYRSQNTEKANNSVNEINQLVSLKNEMVNAIEQYNSLSPEKQFDVEDFASDCDEIIDTYRDWYTYVLEHKYLSSNPFEAISFSETILVDLESYLRMDLASLDSIKIEANNNYKMLITCNYICTALICISVVLLVIAIIPKFTYNKTNN